MDLRPSLEKRSSFPAAGVSQSTAQSQLVELTKDMRHRSYYGCPPVVSAASAPAPRALSFDSCWPLLGGDWNVTEYGHFIATNTINEQDSNRIHILTALPDPQAGLQGFTNVADAVVTLPQTKVAWDPRGASSPTQLKMLSTGDCLRMWNFNIFSGKLEAVCPLVKRSKSSPHGQMAPLTSFDWNRVDNSIVITSSIDTTCTVWDLNTKSVRTQLIAHDSDVYDVAFLAQSPHKFVSVGADGSARVFDLRALDNSTIIFEVPPTKTGGTPPPLLRVAANPLNSNLLACVAHDSTFVYILDIRSPRNPASILDAHTGPVNSVAWAPSHFNQNLLVSGGDDCQALLWDVSLADSPLVAAYTESGQVNSVFWCPTGEYFAATFGRTIQGVASRPY